MAKGTPAFIFVKVKTPADALTESAMIGNMRLTAGKYNDSPIVFNAIVNSYLDDEGSYSASAYTVHNYPVEITLTTGGKATFKHLLPEHSDYPLPQVIEGRIEGIRFISRHGRTSTSAHWPVMTRIRSTFIPCITTTATGSWPARSTER